MWNCPLFEEAWPLFVTNRITFPLRAEKVMTLCSSATIARHQFRTKLNCGWHTLKITGRPFRKEDWKQFFTEKAESRVEWQKAVGASLTNNFQGRRWNYPRSGRGTLLVAADKWQHAVSLWLLLVSFLPISNDEVAPVVGAWQSSTGVEYSAT